MYKLVPREHTIDVSPLVAAVQDADAVGKHLHAVLTDWSLAPDPNANAVYFTSDRGSNVKAALEKAQWATHVPCLSHILHRAVLDAIDATNSDPTTSGAASEGMFRNMYGVWRKVTTLGTAMHMSPNRTAQFELSQLRAGETPLQPVSPCRTRWHGYKEAAARHL